MLNVRGIHLSNKASQLRFRQRICYCISYSFEKVEKLESHDVLYIASFRVTHIIERKSTKSLLLFSHNNVAVKVILTQCERREVISFSDKDITRFVGKPIKGLRLRRYSPLQNQSA